jgi:hypothetical protein
MPGDSCDRTPQRMTGEAPMGSLFLAAIPIDLNLLSRVPGTPVSITADGSQMTITEDEENFNTTVWHIPNFTSPDLIVPALGRSGCERVLERHGFVRSVGLCRLQCTGTVVRDDPGSRPG